MLNFAHQPTDLIWQALAEANRMENELVTKQSWAFAQFVEDYWYSKTGEEGIKRERYLPFAEEEKEDLPYSPEIQDCVTYCLEKGFIPAKFVRLLTEC